MSRIGKLPVNIPDGVQVNLNENEITVKGPKGELTKKFSPKINLEIKDNEVVIERNSNAKEERALHGLTRSLVSNMVEGVTEGFQKSLDLIGVGYRAQLQGKNLLLQVGYSHPIEIEPLENTAIEVPAQNKIVITGIDKEQVGQLAAKIRFTREPENYKGKGVRYEGEYVKIKAGKAGTGKAGA